MYFLAVIKGDVNAPPPRDQLALQRVLDAIYRSADEGATYCCEPAQLLVLVLLEPSRSRPVIRRFLSRFSVSSPLRPPSC